MISYVNYTCDNIWFMNEFSGKSYLAGITDANM